MKYFYRIIIVFFLLRANSLLAQAQTINTPINKPSAPGVYKGKLPESKEYWDYNAWYKNNSVLNVIVSTENKEGLLEVFEELRDLKKKNVLVGKIVLIGSKYIYLISADYADIIQGMKQNAAQNPKINAVSKEFASKEFMEQLTYIKHFSEIKQTIKLPNPSSFNPEDLFKKFDITYSPTWILRYRGKDYIYEGKNNIKRLFTNDGQFIGANDNQ